MERADLWAAFKEQGCQRAREALILAHLGYVKPTLRRIWATVPPGHDPADLEAEARFAVIRAIDQFDPARGGRSSSFVITMIRFAMREYLRQQDWVPRLARQRERETGFRPLALISLEEAGFGSAISDDGSLPVAEGLIDPAAPVAEQVIQTLEQARIRALLRWLPATERQVVIDYYWRGHLQTEIARAMNRCDSRVKQIRQQALARLRQSIGEEADW